MQSKRHQRFCSKGCYLGAWSRENKEANTAAQKKRRAEQPEWYKIREPLYYQRARKYHAENSPWHYPIRSAKARARQLKLPFELTDEWAEARWTGECEASGLEFWKTVGHGPNPFSCTLDRVVGSKGYTKDNCRFVCMGFNGLKGSGTDEEALIIARGLINKASI